MESQKLIWWQRVMTEFKADQKQPDIASEQICREFNVCPKESKINGQLFICNQYHRNHCPYMMRWDFGNNELWAAFEHQHNDDQKTKDVKLEEDSLPPKHEEYRKNGEDGKEEEERNGEEEKVNEQRKKTSKKRAYACWRLLMSVQNVEQFEQHCAQHGLVGVSAPHGGRFIKKCKHRTDSKGCEYEMQLVADTGLVYERGTHMHSDEASPNNDENDDVSPRQNDDPIESETDCAQIDDENWSVKIPMPMHTFVGEFDTNWCLQVRFANDARFDKFCANDGLYRKENNGIAAGYDGEISMFGCNWWGTRGKCQWQGMYRHSERSLYCRSGIAHNHKRPPDEKDDENNKGRKRSRGSSDKPKQKQGQQQMIGATTSPVGIEEYTDILGHKWQLLAQIVDDDHFNQIRFANGLSVYDKCQDRLRLRCTKRWKYRTCPYKALYLKQERHLYHRLAHNHDESLINQKKSSNSNETQSTICSNNTSTTIEDDAEANDTPTSLPISNIEPITLCGDRQHVINEHSSICVKQFELSKLDKEFGELAVQFSLVFRRRENNLFGLTKAENVVKMLLFSDEEDAVKVGQFDDINKGGMGRWPKAGQQQFMKELRKICNEYFGQKKC